MLYGINSMKASTAKQNPLPERLHGYDEGIIIFYCGQSEDRQNVMSYGRNLLNKMNYPRSRLYFKSDVPHLINYSNEYRHMYYIDTYVHYSRMMATKMNKSHHTAKRNSWIPSEYSSTSSVNGDSGNSFKNSSYYFSNNFTHSMQPISQYGYNILPIYNYNSNNYFY